MEPSRAKASRLRVVLAWRNVARLPFNRGSAGRNTDQWQPVIPAAEHTLGPLVRALEAGQAVGGDKRGKQSAAVTTVKDQPYPYVDLRVDEHPDPVAELRRMYEVVKAQMLPFIEALPTRSNPKGNLGEEIRGTLIPNGDLPQANEETTEKDVPRLRTSMAPPQGS